MLYFFVDTMVGIAPDDDTFGLVGQKLEGDRVEIESVAGTGGFSVVYKAWHYTFDGPVAVKCMKVPPRLKPEQHKEYLEKFNREGKLLFRLHKLSPQNIVQVLAMGQHTTAEGTLVPYIILDWLEGSDLDEWLKARSRRGAPPLTLPETIKILDSAAEALARAHAAGIVHRDVKPSNLWVTKEREKVKLLDFGIAKEFDASIPSKRLETKLSPLRPFTPAYAAPEQSDQRLGATGPYTDVFSLAIVCVELLTGRSALGDEDSGAMYEARRTDVRPTPRTKGANVADEVETVFRRALAVSIEERPGDAAEFWRALCVAAGYDVPQWLLGSAPPPSPNAARGPASSGSRLPAGALQQKYDTAPGSSVTSPGGARKRSALSILAYVLLGVGLLGIAFGAVAWYVWGSGQGSSAAQAQPRPPTPPPVTQTAPEDIVCTASAECNQSGHHGLHCCNGRCRSCAVDDDCANGQTCVGCACVSEAR